jgi:uncharacterized repeat protein (TIGR03843 family)
MPSQAWLPDQPDILDVLNTAGVQEYAMLAAGSNYVYLITLNHPVAGEGYAVYKPQSGEAQLSDFPDGSLYRREYAAYLVSEALGWGLVPPTVVRGDGLEGGIGMLQLFIEHDPSQHYFTLKDEHVDEMQRIAVFDWLTNNADRKGGHCLLAANGRIWCIDQGLTFHFEDKLRTVIWEFQGEPVPDAMLADIQAFGQRLATDAELQASLGEMLTETELQRLRHRIEVIGRERVYPPPPPWRPYPWPMI